MNKLVEAYLNKKAREAAISAQKKKEALLIELGLYEKEYSVDDKYSSEYPEGEWDHIKGTTRYYKKVPVYVSNDEYLEILKYQNAAKADVKKNNTISIVFIVLAWVTFIGGFIAGIVLGQHEVVGYYESHIEFSFATALLYWAISFVCGMVFLGFAEIIQLLYDIKNDKLIRS